MLSYCIAVRLWLLVLAITFFMSSDRFHASVQLAFYLFVQVGKTALHEASITGNGEMVAYMMEQVNPNVDARDMVGPRIMGAKLRMMIEWDPVRTAAMQ